MTDLVSAGEIAEFPGAPFPADVLTSAGETVRRICGWMIAPPVADQVVTLDSEGGQYLFLPTLYLTALGQVRDMRDPANPVVLTDVKWERNGTLYRRHRFPCGFQNVEVTFTHGYAACPKELLPVVAAAARTQGDSRLPRQQSLGSASISYETSSAATSAQKVLDAYTIVNI
jgi:hypothetical protein